MGSTRGGQDNPYGQPTGDLNLWREALHEGDLPQTFLDAIRIARFLGLKYLWTDSLCIMQDPKDDWLEQSSLMSDVYKYSYCNIAATVSENDDSGCFSQRDTKRDLLVRI